MPFNKIKHNKKKIKDGIESQSTANDEAKSIRLMPFLSTKGMSMFEVSKMGFKHSMFGSIQGISGEIPARLRAMPVTGYDIVLEGTFMAGGPSRKRCYLMFSTRASEGRKIPVTAIDVDEKSH